MIAQRRELKQRIAKLRVKLDQNTAYRTNHVHSLFAKMYQDDFLTKSQQMSTVDAVDNSKSSIISIGIDKSELFRRQKKRRVSALSL